MLVSTSGSWPLKVIRTNSAHYWTNKKQVQRTTRQLSVLCSFPLFSPPDLLYPSIFLNMGNLHTHSLGDGGMLKMKRKTISSADGPVWGNEIACLIVACNGEQFEVNWGEIGHWATVCRGIVVGRRVYQWENHWTQKKTNSLSDLTNGNYLALTDKIARSIVIVIKFIFFSSVSGSGSSAWKTRQSQIQTLSQTMPKPDYTAVLFLLLYIF